MRRRGFLLGLLGLPAIAAATPAAAAKPLIWGRIRGLSAVQTNVLRGMAATSPPTTMTVHPAVFDAYRQCLAAAKAGDGAALEGLADAAEEFLAEAARGWPTSEEAAPKSPLSGLPLA